MIRRINILMILWLALFTVECISESNDLRYEVYFDSSMNNEIEIKDSILNTYINIVEGVDKDKRAPLVLKNLSLFKLEENWEVSGIGNTVRITIGDGKGTVLGGDFEWILCFNEVKPKSWIKEVLGFYKE